MAADLETLLQSMTGSSPEGQEPVEAMLAQLAETDPRARLISALLARRREAAVAAEPEPTTPRLPAPTPADARRAAERREEFRRLRTLVRSMYEELEELRRRNAVLADLVRALGMCPLCLGQLDPHCLACAGHGKRSGFIVPDRNLFMRYVVPAIRRLRAQGAGSRATPSGRPGPQKVNRDGSTPKAPETGS